MPSMKRQPLLAIELPFVTPVGGTLTLSTGLEVMLRVVIKDVIIDVTSFLIDLSRVGIIRFVQFYKNGIEPEIYK